MINEAVILAGGFGTRLQSVVKDLPKPMAPVREKPFLTYVLDYLKIYGIEHVVLSVGYLHEKIISYFGQEYQGIQISYAIENEPLGTGGGIKLALEKIQGSHAFVLNGDTFFDVDLFLFAAQHEQAKSELSMALRTVDDVDRYGAVKTDEQNRIQSFFEKGATKGQGNINGGVYLLPAVFFKKMSIFTDRFSMEKDVFEKLYQSSAFYGFPSDGYFIDIGIPEDYNKAQKEL
jgi:D-glycero-alpha-D-manno-heptose 1-phosphate guanylyltransferase